MTKQAQPKYFNKTKKTLAANVLQNSFMTLHDILKTQPQSQDFSPYFFKKGGHEYPYETITQAKKSTAFFTETLVQKVPHQIDHVILCPRINCNYDYFYFIIPKYECLQNHPNSFFLELKAIFNQVNVFKENPYFTSFKYPLVIHQPLLHYAAFFYKAPFQEACFKKHHSVLYSNTTKPLEAPAIKTPYSRFLAHITFLIHSTKRRYSSSAPNRDAAISFFVDLLTGQMPASKLLHEKGILATSPQEASFLYQSHFDDELSHYLKNQYDKLITRNVGDSFLSDTYPFISKWRQYWLREFDKGPIANKKNIKEPSYALL